MLIMAGGAWMGTMSAQLQETKKEQAEDRKAIGHVDKKVGIIEEQTKRTQQDVEQLRRGQEKTNEKLDELLRRTPTR